MSKFNVSVCTRTCDRHGVETSRQWHEEVDFESREAAEKYAAACREVTDYSVTTATVREVRR